MRVKKYLIVDRQTSPVVHSVRADFLSLAAFSRIDYAPAAHTVDRVLQAACTASGYSPDQLLGRARTEPLVIARIAAMFVCSRQGLSGVEIDKYFGRKYGSCSHDLRVAKNLLEVDSTFSSKVTLIETLMKTETINPKGE